MINTIQSVKNHKKNNIFENIYNSDITHMINFHFYKKKLKNMNLDSIKIEDLARSSICFCPYWNYERYRATHVRRRGHSVFLVYRYNIPTF